MNKDNDIKIINDRIYEEINQNLTNNEIIELNTYGTNTLSIKSSRIDSLQKDKEKSSKILDRYKIDVNSMYDKATDLFKKNSNITKDEFKKAMYLYLAQSGKKHIIRKIAKRLYKDLEIKGNE